MTADQHATLAQLDLAWEAACARHQVHIIALHHMADSILGRMGREIPPTRREA